MRTLWSNPITRRTLLEKLADAGFGKEELGALQKLIDAEKSDLFDVLEYVFNSDIKPMTREARVAAAQATIFALLDNKQKEFIEIPTSGRPPSQNDHWGFHVTIKKKQPVGCALKMNT